MIKSDIWQISSYSCRNPLKWTATLQFKLKNLTRFNLFSDFLCNIFFQNKNFSDGKDKVILDTREHPLIVSDNFVQFTGVFGAPELLSNGKKMASGDNLVVLYLNSDSQNPRFLVDWKEHDAFSFHWSFGLELRCYQIKESDEIYRPC